jgi:DNA processing protein
MSIAASKLGRDAEIELEESRKLGVKLLSRGSNGYPKAIETISDPPLLLYCQGEIVRQDELAVAIVGSRRCTVYGRQQAEKFATMLARAGVTVISGLARGIDAAAHQGALAGGGRTIAVMGTGLAEIYPPEHRELAAQVSQHGALLTEFKLHQTPHAGHFPQRNRIISGLSVAVVVIEAGRSSGALHTARHAMEQGREVLAVPGRIDSLASEGCHDLIRDGVTLVRHVDDILAAIGPLTKPVSAASDGCETIHSLRELSLNEIERHVLNLITAEPTLQDEIISSSLLEPAQVLATLTVLEMKRLIRRQPGGFFIRSPW